MGSCTRILYYICCERKTQANWSAKTAQKGNLISWQTSPDPLLFLFFSPLTNPPAKFSLHRHQLIYIFISIYFFFDREGFFFLFIFARILSGGRRKKKPRGEAKIHTQAIGKKSYLQRNIERDLIYK